MTNRRSSAIATVIKTFLVTAAIGAAALATIPAFSYENTKTGDSEPVSHRQYTFSWKFVEGDAMAPRGGSTRGVPVTLATEPAAEWRRLQEPGPSDFERDRRAILAMAGEYRVSFDFIEVAGFDAGYEPKRPYQSWGTEKIYVIEDRGHFISLQHVLVTRFIDDEGKVQGPHVVKHWRQDWQYQPESQFVYRGLNTWQTVPVDADARASAWLQSVYQVDDSPRYSGVGRWQHFGNYSTWIGGEGWRPLPRREYSVRDDYDVLAGTNRHTITPTGWIHEQQNNKLDLDPAGKPAGDAPIVGREFGFNRYERIRGFDFSVGDAYLAATEPLWRAVREEWKAVLARSEPVRLKGAPDRDRMFQPMFEMAAALEQEAPADAEALAEVQTQARAQVRDYLAVSDPRIASR